MSHPLSPEYCHNYWWQTQQEQNSFTRFTVFDLKHTARQLPQYDWRLQRLQQRHFALRHVAANMVGNDSQLALSSDVAHATRTTFLNFFNSHQFEFNLQHNE